MADFIETYSLCCFINFLQASHCVHTQRGVISAAHVSVHVGQIHLKKASEYTQIHGVQEIILHPQFRSNSFNNDIALIKLNSNITMNKYVQPVCLWTMDSNQEMIVGKNGTIVGFGLNEQDVVSDQLKQALIGVIDPLTCIASDRAAFGPVLTSDMFCGKGQTGVSACNGDSGGGMFFEVGGKWFVRGLVSFTPLRGNTRLCDPLKYTAYTDVAKYLEWIKKYIDQRVLSFESDVLNIDYEEKLRLFNFKTCGVISAIDTIDGTTKWKLPWIGFVTPQNTNEYRCVVTLISEWYAVGPAHCFRNDGDDSSNIEDNIALIELLAPADTTLPYVKPICLPVTAELRTNAKTNLHVATDSTTDEHYYKNMPVRYLESAECMKQYTKQNITLNLGNNRLCAEIASKQDEQNCKPLIEGSPLQEMKIVGGKEQYFLRGFELHGRACDYESAPPMYINIERYMDWILYNMKYNVLEEVDGGFSY
ncbi:polyserase-2-like [Anopheles arabiensis]|uniref:polyserase-2-like n=1 Tax=Anopheles arabiensis TaxID=7173 RepID=UPI001AACA7C4|nr:polyserase-2-like [Anopheles arabiensis]